MIRAKKLQTRAALEDLLNILGENDFFSCLASIADIADLDASSGSELIDSINNDTDFTVEEITNHNGLYPYPSYGWDGGNAICDYGFNLRSLAQLDIFNGPVAEIVEKKDPSKPAFVLYYYDGDNCWKLVIFK